MTADQFKTLFRTTLTNPRQGGRDVIAQNLPVRGLWMALMLMAILLSLVVSTLFLSTASSTPDELRQVLQASPAYASPIMFAVINWGQAVITVFVLHWISDALGGRGELRDMLTVMIWLQVMSLTMAAFLFFLAIVLPSIGGILMIVAFLWGIWAFVAFVDAAAQFENMFKSVVVCIFAFAAFTVGMSAIAFVITGIAAGGV